VCGCADQSFQSLVIFFFLKPSQTVALLSIIQQLSGRVADADITDDDNLGDLSICHSVADSLLACVWFGRKGDIIQQHIDTHSVRCGQYHLL